MSGWILWEDEDAALVAEMRDLYRRWAASHLGTWSGSRNFIRFLRQDVAASIILDGLVWLADADIGWFVDDRTAKNLAHALAKGCQQERTAVLWDAKVREAFLLLLGLLRDNAIALQITDEIDGS